MTKSTGVGRHPPSQKTHGQSFVNGKATPEYSAWSSMKSRCNNPKMNNYHLYGARGITVCERWMSSFEAFLEDMGKKPKGYSLERIDNEKGYTPENCKWATYTEQCRNRRSTRRVVFEGEEILLPVLAEKFSISLTKLRQRLDRGWPPERAVL